MAFLTVSISPAASQQPIQLPVNTLTGEQLVQQAMEQYREGDYAAAQVSLESAIEKFDPEHRPLARVISLGNLSFIHQQAGHLPAATTALQQSIDLLETLGTTWRSPLDENPHPAITARLLNISGRLSYVQGNPATALENWEQASRLYAGLQQSAKDTQKALQYRQQLMTSKLNQVQALQSSGRHLRSCAVLVNALSLNDPVDTADQSPLLDCQNSNSGPSFTEKDPDFKELLARVDSAFTRDQLSIAQRTSVWQSLGEVLRVLGRLEDSRKVLKAGLTTATNFTLPDTLLTQAKQFQNEDTTEPETLTPLMQDRPQLTPLYISLGNTLTAMGELERDRQNTIYEDAKFLTSKFGCFSQGEENNGTVSSPTSLAERSRSAASENSNYIDDDSDNTVAELYQRAALCYKDAILTEEGNRSVLLDLKIQLNWLNLSISHLKWLLEDSSSLITSEEGNDVTEIAKEKIRALIQRQTKTVQTQISQLDCMRSRIDQLPNSQAKIYAQLNLSRSLAAYLTLDIINPTTGNPVTQQLPQPSRIENILAHPPDAISFACKVRPAIVALPDLSSARDDDLTKMGGQQLWGDIAALLTAAEQESQELYQHWTDTQWDSTAEATLDRQLLGNKRLESEATGNLGYLYEALGSKYAAEIGTLGSPAIAISESLFQQAQVYTVKALEFAQPDKAPDIAYRWQWQLGRLLKRQGDANRETAIDVYQTAVGTLTKARKNLSIIDSEAQFSFRDNVEPVYRELMDLLLRPEPGKKVPSQNNLRAVIRRVSELQLAELENFLRCNIPPLTAVEEIKDPNAAIIHAVLHGDALTLIVELPDNDELIPETISINQQDVRNTVNRLYESLSSGDIGGVEEPEGAYAEGIKVYNWLISPIRKLLAENVYEGTLVFDLDSFLRKTPLAFLNNGNAFLIQEYAIAFAPRQKIYSSILNRNDMSVLVGGVGSYPEYTKGIEGLKDIIFLDKELDSISKSGAPVDARLQDEEFTLAKLRQALQIGSHSVIHLKTHGTFSSNPNKTFIAAYDQPIRPYELRELIQTATESKGEPLDLLVLSACSAAEGDDRAVLGLAGIATVTGTRSAISALWNADDKFNTQFMEIFYQSLSTPGTTKAQALRAAQVKFIKTEQDPKHWSNYILVGDWL